jgi:2-haloalkanoic acid dehalogenase type II
VASEIEAVVFDCFGTLIDFGDEAFAAAYGVICVEQGIDIDGKTFYDKWMEIWRRLTVNSDDSSPSTAAANGTVANGTTSNGASPNGATVANTPGPLSEAKDIPEHPEHHAPSAGRNRALDGPVGPFRTYREEWTEHFALCFEELGVKGDAAASHERMRELLCQAPAFPESRRIVAQVGRRLPVAVLSNADDDFLHLPLSRNGLVFPLIISSETARAYKPHVAIFRYLSESLDLEPEQILYVGDSRLADVTGAKHAGMQAAWVNRKRTTEWSATNRELLEPDYEMATLDGLMEVLGV